MVTILDFLIPLTVLWKVVEDNICGPLAKLPQDDQIAILIPFQALASLHIHDPQIMNVVRMSLELTEIVSQVSIFIY
jgi:hypothetical protein